MKTAKQNNAEKIKPVDLALGVFSLGTAFYILNQKHEIWISLGLGLIIFILLIIKLVKKDFVAPIKTFYLPLLFAIILFVLISVLV